MVENTIGLRYPRPNVISDPELIDILDRHKKREAAEKIAIAFFVVVVGVPAAIVVVWSLWWTLLHTVLEVI